MDVVMQTRLIPQKPQTYFQVANIHNRPTRLAYIVNQNLNQAELRSLLQYNASIWGGRFSLFVPSNGHEIRGDWWRLLLKHDPDIVLYVGDFSQTLKAKIVEQIQPFTHMNWSNEIPKSLELGYDRFGLPAITIFQHYNNTEGPVREDSNCVYPIIHEGRFANYFYTAFGNYSLSEYQSIYVELLAAQVIECNPQNLQEYLSIYDAFVTKMTPLRFASRNLNTIYINPISMYGASIIIDGGSIDNLFLFHSLASSPHAFKNAPYVIIPLEFLHSDEDYAALSQWIEANVTGSTFIHLMNTDADLEPLRTVREHLKPLLTERFKNVDLLACNFDADFPNVFDRTTQQQIRIDDKTLNIVAPDLDLALSTRKTTGWIVELELAPGLLNTQGFIPSRFLGMNLLLSGYSLKWLNNPVNRFPSSSVRVSRNLISFQASKGQIRTLSLPTTDDLFTLLFENHDWQVRRDEKGRYYQGMLKLVGDLSSMAILRDEIGSKLFTDDDFRAGKAYTIDEMLKRFKLGKRISDLKETVLNLSMKSVLLRGYSLRCASCDLTRWYSIRDGNERMICQGCLSEFQMPPDAEQSFRLNELFMRGFEQGGHAIVLTLMLLKSSVHNSLIWDVGYKLKDSENQEVDIDLVAMCDGFLILGECKDSLPASKDELLEQLGRDVKIAEKVGASAFIFSTFSSDIPEYVTEFINEFEKQSLMPIYIFNQADLMRGRLIDSGDSWIFIRDLLKPNRRYKGVCSDEDTDNSLGARLVVM